MASITSLTSNSSSSTSSLYGNRNVISGLASGMDTEAMINNSISGYKSKITALQQRMTKLQWKQDAYRGLITQMNNITSKYTSFTSSTNLFGSSFFTRAVNTVANGANASAVSATGKSTSNVAIDRIKQLAEAASYTVGTSHLVSEGSSTSAINWDKVETSNVSGSISFKYGGGESGKGSTFTLHFDESEIYESPEKLADAINEKLKEKNISGSDGAKSADTYIKASAKDGKVVIEDQKGNYFAITGVSGKMGELFKTTGTAENLGDSGKKGFTSEAIAVNEGDDGVKLVDKKDATEFLKDKTINVTLDGRTKTIKLEDVLSSDKFTSAATQSEGFAAALQDKLNDEFGDGKIKVSAENGALKIEGPSSKGSSLKIASSNDIVNETLGLGKGGYSNTMETGWSLEKVFGSRANGLFDSPERARDEKGNMKVDEDQNPIYLDKDGKETTDENLAQKVGYISINGKSIELKATDTINDMMDKINSSDAGVEIKYSSLTGNFAITSKDTGAENKITISGEGKLGAALFGTVDSNGNVTGPEGTASGAKGPQYKDGQDAVFTATINGEEIKLTRSSNTVNLDGMSVTLKKTFGYNADGTEDKSAEKISFTTSSDSDKIVDAVKSFVEDYNKLVTALHSAYTTQALQTSSGKDYEPLTDDDMSSMSESAIKAYEDKAKTGILFGDQDLSNLYSRLTQAVQSSGKMGATLRSIGLDVTYSNGLSTLSLDEEALRSALDSDPDKVKDAFTQSQSRGASQDGLMAGLKNTLDMYGSTSIGSPGILVNKSGSELSSYSLSHNEMQEQLDNLQKEIENWQDKMSNRVDFYTNQFTQLEMLINQMNSQSSMLSGMMGG